MANAHSMRGIGLKGQNVVGVDYTSGAFFGTFAKNGTAAEAEIMRRRNEDSGEFDFDAVPNVRLGRHGNSWSGDFDYAVKQTRGHAFVSHAGGHSGPFTIADAQPDAIKAAIELLGLDINDFEPIGFYLYLDVW